MLVTVPFVSSILLQKAKSLSLHLYGATAVSAVIIAAVFCVSLALILARIQHCFWLGLMLASDLVYE